MREIADPNVQEFETDHIGRLRRLAPECAVLLKSAGDFPLSGPCSLALYGSGARQTIKGGTGSGDVNVRHFVTIEEGLAAAGFEVVTTAWLDAYGEAKKSSIAGFYRGIAEEAKKAGKSIFEVGLGRSPVEPEYSIPLEGEADTCVYVLARNSGEGADRKDAAGDFQLTQTEIRDIRACANRYPHFMLVLNVGGPLDLSPVVETVGNILLLGQLGSVTGTALADILLGKANPSGRLAATWAASKDLCRIGDFAETDDTEYREGVFVGYRYFDAVGKKPLFPFGYGLSFTEFSIDTEGLSVEGAEIRVRVQVKNVGSRRGKRAVGLFFSAPQGKLVKPVRELGAFAKTRELEPGEAEELTLALSADMMASWDDSSDSWILEKGDYVLSVDGCLAGAVSLARTVACCHLGHFGGEALHEDFCPEVGHAVPDGLMRIELDPCALEGRGHLNGARIAGASLHKLNLSDCSDGDLAEFCCGKHGQAQISAAMIGSSSSRLAGGAGETCQKMADRGIGSLVMADGPAGLRVATKYFHGPEGEEALDSGSFDSIIGLLPDSLRQALLAKMASNEEAAKGKQVLYHYASAIPVATAIGQSWNVDVAAECGNIVAEEMQLFGANVWLAPALNIQRSPLCGRNFEYYSEDPVISGKMAAGMTRAVQSHKGCAVTIKHFACNNQETGRVGSNSIVSRRALREIYLKGFEICVKEAAPLALMSSYNLLNGTHTANRRDLLTCILRDEWGFSGLVMTDWGTTSGRFNYGTHGPSDAAACIAAGNDLIMPGTPADVDGIMAGLKDGRISRHDLELCARRICAVAEILK